MQRWESTGGGEIRIEGLKRRSGGRKSRLIGCVRAAGQAAAADVPEQELPTLLCAAKEVY